MAVVAGSTPKYLIRLRDEQGVQLNPSDTSQVTDVRIIIFNAISGDVIGRFYLNSSPGEGWIQLSNKIVAYGDHGVLMVLTGAMTTAAAGNANMIQVDVLIPDSEAPGGTYIIKQQGRFHEILPSKS